MDYEVKYNDYRFAGLSLQEKVMTFLTVVSGLRPVAKCIIELMVDEESILIHNARKN